MAEEFLTVLEAAKALDVHPITVNRYCKKGLLTYYQVGPRKRFLQTDIDTFLNGAKRHARKYANDDINDDENPFAAR